LAGVTPEPGSRRAAKDDGQIMGVRYEELRRVCQKPVADGNDVAGLLFGDKASLPFTKLLIDFNLSPSVATVGMLVTGVLGSAMQFGSAGWVVAGALLLLFYYVLDCVDGEVARWRRVEHALWGYYEYIFHFVVKPVCFVSIAFATWLEFGHTALLVAGVAAAVSTLWLKLFFGLPSMVFTGAVFGRRFSGDRPYSAYLEDAARRAKLNELEAIERQQKADAPKSSGAVFRLRLDRVTIRSLATNFDIGLALLVLASLGDMAGARLPFPGGGELPLRGLWLLYYGLVLPIDFIDYVRTYFKQRHFDKQMVRLLAAAHGFVLTPDEPGGGADPDVRPDADAGQGRAVDRTDDRTDDRADDRDGDPSGGDLDEGQASGDRLDRDDLEDERHTSKAHA
jgi:hypothetical protein